MILVITFHYCGTIHRLIANTISIYILFLITYFHLPLLLLSNFLASFLTSLANLHGLRLGFTASAKQILFVSSHPQLLFVHSSICFHPFLVYHSFHYSTCHYMPQSLIYSAKPDYVAETLNSHFSKISTPQLCILLPCPPSTFLFLPSSSRSHNTYRMLIYEFYSNFLVFLDISWSLFLFLSSSSPLLI